MKFLSAARIGEHTGLTRGEVNKILIQNNVLSKDGKTPTENATNNNLCEIRKTVSKFTRKEVNYLAWNCSVLASLFPAQSTKPEKTAVRILTPYGAFETICDALSDFGDILRIELGEESQLSTKAHNAVVEAYFADVECLGATRLAHGHFLKNEAEAARSKLLPIAEELHQLASCISQKRADRNLEKIKQTMAWLYSNAK